MSRNWSEVLFSDEKKWRIDGPDGWSSYWLDLRKEPKHGKTTIRQGPGVMIWAAFSQRIKTSLAFVQETLDSVAYQNVLNDHLMPFLNTDSIFQQDNAPCHVPHYQDCKITMYVPFSGRVSVPA